MDEKKAQIDAAAGGTAQQLNGSTAQRNAGFPLEPEDLRAEIEVAENQRKYRLVHVFDLVTADDWLEFDRMGMIGA